MCDPVTVFTVASTLYGAKSQMDQANYASDVASSQAKQAKQEADFQQKQTIADAQAERDAAVIKAEKIRKAGAEQRAQTRAAAAASGMTVDMGTALDLTTEVTKSAEQDAQMSIFGGLDAFRRGSQEASLINAKGKNESASLKSNASALKSQGRAAMLSGFISAGNKGYDAYLNANK